MPAPAVGLAARRWLRRLAGVAIVPVLVVLAADPAAAHDIGGGALPTPPWLLGYIGAFGVAATAVALRATWLTPRLDRLEPVVLDADPETDAEHEVPATGALDAPKVGIGNLVGLGLLVGVLVAAIVGPDSSAANIAPVAVLIVWWVGLPIACLLLGDVMRVINPFVALHGLTDRGRATRRDPEAAPPWTAAAFLGAFAWYFIAYHRPGSPRALAVLLVAYTAAAVAGAHRWGRGWLTRGEGFAALSRSLGLLSPRPRGATAPPGVAALAIVWIGSSAFDAYASTPFWVDVLGTSRGWSRTLLNTMGLVWLTALVAMVYLAALRLARLAQPSEDRPSLLGPLGLALVPVGAAWFLAHDLTLLLFEGQNFVALLSDPVARGWDLFGTIGRTIDYGIVQATWVRWTEVALVAVGHVVAVVIAHDLALRLVRPRAAIRATWAIAGVSATSIIAAALMVLG